MKLTEIHSPGLVEQIRATKPGQAHWACGDGRTCRECVHWKPAQHRLWDDDTGRFVLRDLLPYTPRGRLRTRRCMKHKEFAGQFGQRLGHEAAACRYFEATATPPEVWITPTMDNSHLWQTHGSLI